MIVHKLKLFYIAGKFPILLRRNIGTFLKDNPFKVSRPNTRNRLRL